MVHWGIHMRTIAAVIIVLFSTQAHAEQKKAQVKPRACTYDQCVAVNKARGWDSSAVSRWCTANPGKCDN
jgi:hypothetical protein